jgi:hypothetical protein
VRVDIVLGTGLAIGLDSLLAVQLPSPKEDWVCEPGITSPNVMSLVTHGMSRSTNELEKGCPNSGDARKHEGKAMGGSTSGLG